jgi:hypothetical protein
LLLALLAASVAHAADGSGVVLRLEPSGAPGRLLASATGMAFDCCPPTLAAAELKGSTLVLRAVAADAACVETAQPYALRSGPLPKAAADVRVYRVRMEVQADPDSTPWLEAFALLAPDRQAESVLPETGFWWAEQGGEFDRAAPGFGVLVEVQDGTVAVSVSSYDEFGNPEWLMGAAPLDGPASTITLGRLHGGRGPHDGFRNPDGLSAAGRLHIEWISAARAQFWFERPAAEGLGIELVPVSMVRFGFANETGKQWLGRWLLAAEQDFEGMPAPRTVDFIDVTAIEGGFLLQGAGGERLQCTLDPRRPNSPPDLCQLQIGDDEYAFSDVALGRLRRATASAPLSLIRLDR